MKHLGGLQGLFTVRARASTDPIQRGRVDWFIGPLIQPAAPMSA